MERTSFIFFVKSRNDKLWEPKLPTSDKKSWECSMHSDSSDHGHESFHKKVYRNVLMHKYWLASLSVERTSFIFFVEPRNDKLWEPKLPTSDKKLRCMS